MKLKSISRVPLLVMLMILLVTCDEAPVPTLVSPTATPDIEATAQARLVEETVVPDPTQIPLASNSTPVTNATSVPSDTLDPEKTIRVLKLQNFLLENFGDPGFGKGISAMPSMHNALYLLLIWMLYDRFGASWQLGLALIFELVVFVASVHLGWHYAMDGIVSAVLVPPVWYFAKNIERWQIVKSAHSRTIPELKLA